ncbi:hypothetical protein GCM10010307_54150 [Streptomyces vastus]|uniref:Uncharacterized protein n=1 Tax=Streptomyces vastus TaxID=285451 RepID=A0ABN3RA34_9ACTN
MKDWVIRRAAQACFGAWAARTSSSAQIRCGEKALRITPTPVTLLRMMIREADTATLW